MDFTAMDARAYRGLNADQYEERRSLVLSLAEELPEDATEEQIRSIDEELGFIKAEDSRRDAMTELRNHKAAEVIGGAGEVVGTTEQKVDDMVSLYNGAEGELLDKLADALNDELKFEVCNLVASIAACDETIKREEAAFIHKIMM